MWESSCGTSFFTIPVQLERLRGRRVGAAVRRHRLLDADGHGEGAHGALRSDERWDGAGEHRQLMQLTSLHILKKKNLWKSWQHKKMSAVPRAAADDLCSWCPSAVFFSSLELQLMTFSADVRQLMSFNRLLCALLLLLLLLYFCPYSPPFPSS